MYFLNILCVKYMSVNLVQNLIGLPDITPMLTLSAANICSTVASEPTVAVGSH